MTRLEAELYALTHRGNAGDVDFYAGICAGADSVLELGSGYGRLLPELVREAKQVCGLELDPALLALGRQRARVLPHAQRARVALFRGDMQAFDLGRAFERIILPYNGLYCLRSPAAVVRCFRRVRAHLAPGGVFAADVWAADRFHRHAGSAAHHDDAGPILTLRRGAVVWDVFETSRLRHREQRLDVTYTYVARKPKRTVRTRIQQRYLRRSELTELLARAGLRLDAVFGDFAGDKVRTSSEHLVFTARPA